MITSFDVYLALVLPNIAITIMGICSLGLICLPVACVIVDLANDNCCGCGDNEDDWRYPNFKFWLPLLIIPIILMSFIPSQKEMAAIYLIPKIANNQDINQVPTNIAKLLNAETKKYINSILNGRENNDASTNKKNR